MDSNSSGYSVEYVAGKGRSLIARRSYEIGEEIFLEQPLVVAQYSWNKLYGYAACDHCLRPLETLSENLTRLLTKRPDHILDDLPDHDRLAEIDQTKHVACVSGCGAKYCNDECRQESSTKYHRFLCFTSTDVATNPILKLDTAWRSMHYPPETAGIQLIVRLMAILKSTDLESKKSLIESLSLLKADAIDTENGFIHKILRDDFQAQLQELVDILSNDFRYLQSDENSSITIDWLTKIFTMVGLNGQGVGGSPFNRYVINYQKENPEKSSSSDQAESTSKADTAIDELYRLLDEAVGLEFLNSDGTGLYALQSTCNHSCEPNAKIEFPFNNATLALTTRKSIKNGEEITISYLDECQLNRSRHSRRKALMENYLFACQCSKCEREQIEPDLTSDEEEDEDDENGMDEH